MTYVKEDFVTPLDPEICVFSTSQKVRPLFHLVAKMCFFPLLLETRYFPLYSNMIQLGVDHNAQSKLVNLYNYTPNKIKITLSIRHKHFTVFQNYHGSLMYFATLGGFKCIVNVSAIN